LAKKKVFVGLNNISGLAASIAIALRSVDVYCKSYSYTKHSFDYSIDSIIFQFSTLKPNQLVRFLKINFVIHSLNKFLRWVYLIIFIFKYNVFIFISVDTILKKRKDLQVLKLFQKTIIFLFVGCPERDPLASINLKKGAPCFKCTDNRLKNICLCNNRNKKKSLIKYIEERSDNIVGSLDVRSFLKEPEKVIRGFVISPNPSNQQRLLSKFNNEKIIISHFPSNKLLKGTHFIKKIMDGIKKKYKNKIAYYSQKLDNKDVLLKLEDTHILIDQFNGLHGILAVEAMARGCVVIASLSDWFIEDRRDIPIINTDLENLENTINKLIESPMMMKEIAQKSIVYFNKYHSPRAVGNFYNKIIDLN
jgi:hypothetical protein